MHPAPIFLLSCGRSGSTLAQRLLNLSPDITIWGEHGGFLKGIAESYFRFHESEEIRTLMRNAPEDFRSLIGAAKPEGSTYWHNCLNDEGLAEGIRNLISGFFTRDVPSNIHWGFKEVRYGHDDRVISMLHALFPKAHFLYLFRHPDGYARSALNAWQADEIAEYNDEQIRHQYNLHLVRWQYNTRFYLDHLAKAETAKPLAITFEALTSAPAVQSQRLFNHLGIAAPGEIDGVFAKRPNKARPEVVERLTAVTPILQPDEGSLLLWDEILAAIDSSN